MSAFPLLPLWRDPVADLTQVSSPFCKSYISHHLQLPMDVYFLLTWAAGIVLLLAQTLDPTLAGGSGSQPWG